MRERQPERIERLRAVPLLRDLTKRQLQEVDRRTNHVERPAGATLLREGRPGLELCMLLEGRVRVVRKGRTLAHLEAGDLFGEMSLLDRQPAVASVVAETPVSLLVLDSRDFNHLLEEMPRMQRTILSVLSSRLRRADESLTI